MYAQSPSDSRLFFRSCKQKQQKIETVVLHKRRWNRFEKGFWGQEYITNSLSLMYVPYVFVSDEPHDHIEGIRIILHVNHTGYQLQSNFPCVCILNFVRVCTCIVRNSPNVSIYFVYPLLVSLDPVLNHNRVVAVCVVRATAKYALCRKTRPINLVCPVDPPGR